MNRNPFLVRDALAVLPLPLSVPEPQVALSRFRGSAFMANRDEPVHRWIPWIAGFSTAFVEDCLTAFITVLALLADKELDYPPTIVTSKGAPRAKWKRRRRNRAMIETEIGRKPAKSPRQSKVAEVMG